MAETNVSQGSVDDASAASACKSTEIRRLRLTLAVERWPGGGATLYGAAQGLFLALLKAGEATTAREVHDTQGRKPFALGPLVVSPAMGNLAQATLEVSLWDARLAEALTRGTSAVLDRQLNLVGHPAHVLDCESVEQTDFVQLACGDNAPHVDADGALQVRFVTPTVFSWGRGLDGRHTYGLLPIPELVVGSWLRAWRAGGGPELPLHGEDDWLRARIALQTVRSLRTVTVHTGKSQVSGFVGEVALAWTGGQPGGARALRTLAGFACFAGTGSKTAYGLGRTEVNTVPSGRDGAE